MKKLFFKPKVPVKLPEIKTELEKAFPEYDYRLVGISKKHLIVRQTAFRGVRVFESVGRLWVKRTPPTFLGALIDNFTFKIISSYVNHRLSLKIIDFLKERYG